MSEQDPSFKIKSGDSILEARRDNAFLYMFWGDLASRNHVFIQMEETEDDRNLGTYLFDPDCDWFDDVATYMIDRGFTAHLNLHEVAECDENAYQRYIDQRATRESDEAGDFLPDSWLGGESM